MDAKRLLEIEEAYEKNNVMLGQVCSQDEEAQILELARLAIQNSCKHHVLDMFQCVRCHDECQSESTPQDNKDER